MLLDKSCSLSDLSCSHSEIMGQFNRRFQPEFCLATIAKNVNMHSSLFTREEVKTESSCSKDCRTQRRGSLFRKRPIVCQD